MKKLTVVNGDINIYKYTGKYGIGDGSGNGSGNEYGYGDINKYKSYDKF